MKYYIITYGCQMNYSDSERIAAVLEKSGYKPASKESEANLIVINVCSVRQSAIDRVYGKIRQIKDKKIILAGCLLKADKEKLKDKVDEIWDIVDFDLKPKYQSPFSASLPIMTGCNNFCSYCVVPYTRGKEKSRPAEEIICEVKNLAKRGYKEIALLGQNVNSYSSEKINFPKLLKIVNDIPGDFQIKFLTSHPKDMSNELIKTITDCKKISKEIHLPVQSGDNAILKKMNRGYAVNQYKNLVKKIRRKIPKAKISTDVIVGFPGETDKQFQNTVKLFKEIKFSKAYINKYSIRVGTAASRLKDNVPTEEKKRRWNIINEIVYEQSSFNKNG